MIFFPPRNTWDLEYFLQKASIRKLMRFQVIPFFWKLNWVLPFPKNSPPSWLRALVLKTFISPFSIKFQVLKVIICYISLQPPQKDTHFDSFSDFLKKLETTSGIYFRYYVQHNRIFPVFSRGFTYIFLLETPKKDIKISIFWIFV